MNKWMSQVGCAASNIAFQNFELEQLLHLRASHKSDLHKVWSKPSVEIF